jgi:hypothetical protein
MARCSLVVCGETPATQESSLAVSARPSISAIKILARAGLPTNAAISATAGCASLMAKT